jgi:hypothetical protein
VIWHTSERANSVAGSPEATLAAAEGANLM